MKNSLNPLNYYFFLKLIPQTISLILFGFTLNYYFLQDDFFHLLISEANNIHDLATFFLPRNDIIGYRPMTIEIYFFVARSLFGLNPIYFRVLIFAAFFLSFLFITKLSKQITQNKQSSLIAAFMWVTASFHFMALAWISASYNIIGNLFYLISTVLFISYVKHKNNICYILSLLIFIFAILSFEFSITLPLMLIVYSCLIIKLKIKRVFWQVLPFLTMSLIYMLARLILKQTPNIEEYQPVVNIYSFKALFWYFLWSLNVPEEFKNQVKNFFIILNPVYFSYFPKFIITCYISFISLFTLGIIVPLYLILKKKLQYNINIIYFCLVWFVVTISPVLLLPKHSFLMYLTLPAVGIYILIGYLITCSKSRLLKTLIISIWTLSSFLIINFYKHTSYFPEAQMVAKIFSENVKTSLSGAPNNSVVLYNESNSAHIQALSDQNAIKIFTKKTSVNIYYNREKLIEAYSSGIIKPPIFILNLK